MTITNSTFTTNTGFDGGGAIQNTGILSISGSTFTGNGASGPNNQQSGEGSGGAISIQGAGQITIANSVISGNSAVNSGGGIYYQPNTSGALMNITNTTISDNTGNSNNDASGDGGGLYISGPGVATVRGSTISGNAINGGDGGGFYVEGALTLDNSTVSDNFAGGSFGGIKDTNPGGTANQVHISNSTIVNNRAAVNVGGMGSASVSDVGQNSLGNSIVANNSSSGTSQDVFGDIGSSGYNLVKNTTGGTVGGTTNIIGQDPLLGPLNYNGGPTRTHALLSGSPAIDKGASGSLTTDQRGLPRPFDDSAIPNASGGNGADIGSFEGQAPGPSVVQFSASNYNIQEDNSFVTVTVNRVGDNSGAASVDYQTSDVSATERRDYITALGKLQFASGETSKSFIVLINEDSNVEGNETFNVNLTNPSGASLGGPAVATVSIVDDVSEPSTNAIDEPRTFVCQNYHDSLNRQPDSGGWDFWTNQTTNCGNPDQLVCRVNVSASFFLSIEFQETGYGRTRLQSGLRRC